ncbi:hypothetical protein WICMUC_002230 [Wickerhamomyces mucosus]|uniref:Uncharacterized protein n=1 Tax=Wickerhamomyces mucosus TaxID=1378264 RepID=A0A9P8TEK5_9ASCO|nr:hypothetical protein WICMUC_002230 [Wickerhamomyces mucosus]
MSESYDLMINHWKNRFKRLAIEFHHLKNRTSPRDNVILKRDPTKPFITLRSSSYRNSQANINPIIDIDLDAPLNDIDQNQFEGFDGVYDENYDEPTLSNRRNLGSSLNGLLYSFREGATKSLEDVQRMRSKCNCSCHHEHNIIVDTFDSHDQYCIMFCVQRNNLKENGNIEQLLLDHHVNYIEPSIFIKPNIGSLWPLKQENLLSVFKRWVGENTKLPKNFKDIEIIAQSNCSVPTQDEDEISSNNLENEEKCITSVSDCQSTIENLIEVSSSKIESSFSRKQYRNSFPIISNLDKYNRERFSIFESKQRTPTQSSPESWKVVMNDISLYAALISTGSKPVLQSKSSLNLVADFTTSKHQDGIIGTGLLNTKSPNTAIYEPELISLNEENTVNYPPKLLIANDENKILETGISDLKNLQGYVNHLTSDIKKSLDADTVFLQSGEAHEISDCSTYSGVLQAYNYSNENIDTPKTLAKPLM